MHIFTMFQHMQQAPAENRNHMKGQENEKKEKMSIISPTNAIVDPWTMMIKCLR